MNNIKTQSITVSPIIKKRGRPKRFPPQYVPEINFENFDFKEEEKKLAEEKIIVPCVKDYIINECKDAREALLLSAKFLTSQSYGGLLETFFSKYFGLSKIKESQDGDLNSKLGNIEVKVSIEHSKSPSQFCMMQLRPAHNVDYYLGTFYSYTQSNIKYILVPSNEMKSIILKYCSSFSHGTKKGKGPVTKELIENDTEAEFQFTFDTTPSKNKMYKIWLELEPFVYLEQELKEKLNINEL